MPATYLLIAITCVVSFLAFKRDALMQKLILFPPAIFKRGEVWRLVTSGFLHADFTHLLFNMITFYFFGRLMEMFFASRVGEVGYVLFYLGGIVVASLPSAIQHRTDVRYASLGASGAVSAIVFGFVLLQPWALIFVFFFPLPAILYAIGFVAYSFYMERKGGGHINHSAHLWGAAYGILVTLWIDPGVAGWFLTQLLHPHF